MLVYYSSVWHTLCMCLTVASCLLRQVARCLEQLQLDCALVAAITKMRLHVGHQSDSLDRHTDQLAHAARAKLETAQVWPPESSCAGPLYSVRPLYCRSDDHTIHSGNSTVYGVCGLRCMVCGLQCMLATVLWCMSTAVVSCRQTIW